MAIASQCAGLGKGVIMSEYNGNEIHDGLIETIEDVVFFRAVWGLVLLGVAVVVIGFMVMLICA